jgi:uncharacterized protein YcbK (DUF882 family)
MNINVQLSKHFHFGREAFRTSYNQTRLIEEFHALPEQMQQDIFQQFKKLAEMIEPYREENGQRMDPESGWRSKRVHEAIYRDINLARKKRGLPPIHVPADSWHFRAALDFHFSDLKPGLKEKLWKEWPGGMGLYSWGIHLDPGPYRRW